MVKYVFQESYYAFSKCNLSLTYCRVNLYTFSFAKFFKLSSTFCSPIYPNELIQFLFVITVRNARNVSLESFVFNALASTVLSNSSWWTSGYLHRYYLWLVYQSILGPCTKLHFRIWQKLSFSGIHAWGECTKVLNVKIVSHLILAGC